MDSIIDRAIALHLPVFPVRANKIPACPHGFKDAVSEPAAIAELWRRHPGPLISVPTGIATGITVLDIDAPHGLVWLNSHLHRLPETRAHVSPHGGYHFIYRTPDPPLRNSASFIARGVDVRGEGGSIIWWPATGGELASEAEIAPFPRWLITFIKRKKTLLEKKRQQRELLQGDIITGNIEGLLRFVHNSREGERNARLFWAAARAGEMVAHGKLGMVEAERALFAAAVGPDPIENLNTIRSGLQRGK
jgi:Bifunctional DNA primase/polymerase, N-terminal